MIRNNLSFDNRSSGFDTNGASGTIEFLNNTAYNNGSGYGFILSTSWQGTAVAHYLRNNISIGSVSTGGDQTFNSWNLPVSATAADFLSVDANLAVAPRNGDGSLPTNKLFRLAQTSDLVDKGVNVGIPYRGAAPDLGAYELAVPAAPKNLKFLP
jgi:hypothetical protein